jgi:signal transduction histidine kinase
LRVYVDGFVERSKIKVDLEIPGDFGRLSQESETTIFRVVQETLTNIHRHSGSRVARICLSHSDNEVIVEVQDKGVGISAEKQANMEQASGAGVGIRGMRERLRQLHGILEVSPARNGTGTVVIARLPVSRSSVNSVASVQNSRD